MLIQAISLWIGMRGAARGALWSALGGAQLANRLLDERLRCAWAGCSIASPLELCQSAAFVFSQTTHDIEIYGKGRNCQEKG
jgi:hypothetical protein